MKLSKLILILILLTSCSAIDSLEHQQQDLKKQIEILNTEIAVVRNSNAELRNMLEVFIEEQASLAVPLVYMPVCSKGTKKSWMSYLAITSPSSRQYAQQQIASTDLSTGYRMLYDRVMVAMGPQYGPVGKKLNIFFEDGQSIRAIIGDIKHQGCTSSDGSMLEFIVDVNYMLQSVRKSGDYNDVYKGQIVAITEEPKT